MTPEQQQQFDTACERIGDDLMKLMCNGSAQQAFAFITSLFLHMAYGISEKNCGFDTGRPLMIAADEESPYGDIVVLPKGTKVEDFYEMKPQQDNTEAA